MWLFLPSHYSQYLGINLQSIICSVNSVDMWPTLQHTRRLDTNSSCNSHPHVLDKTKQLKKSSEGFHLLLLFRTAAAAGCTGLPGLDKVGRGWKRRVEEGGGGRTVCVDGRIWHRTSSWALLNPFSVCPSFNLGLVWPFKMQYLKKELLFFVFYQTDPGWYVGCTVNYRPADVLSFRWLLSSVCLTKGCELPQRQDSRTRGISCSQCK